MSDEVTIPAGSFREALAVVLGGPPTGERLTELTDLDWSEYRREGGEEWYPLEDLTGIEHCTRLESLGLDGNSVRSLETLRGHPSLRSIHLCQNGLRSLRGLEGVVHLARLVVDMNKGITDVEPLRGLPALQYVNLAYTGVADVTPLVACSALTELNLDGVKLDVAEGSPNRAAIVALLRRGVLVKHHEVELLRAEANAVATSGDPVVHALHARGALRVAALRASGRTDEEGRTALHLAVRPALGESPDPVADRAAVTRILLDAGVDIEARERTGLTPLHYLVQHHPTASIDVLRTLLDAGASPNVRSGSGETPLESALALRREDLVDLLIERGADTSSPTTFDAFCLDGFTDRVRAALDAGHDPKRPAAINAAALGDHVAAIEMLLVRGARIDAADPAGATPLHRARHPDTVRYLLDHGAPLDVMTASGETPLTSMAAYRDPVCLRLLIEAGASATVRDRQGNTLLHALAFNGGDLGPVLEVVELLLARGVDPNARNANGETPLDHCRYREVERRIRAAGGLPTKRADDDA